MPRTMTRSKPSKTTTRRTGTRPHGAARKPSILMSQVDELLLQALETETGGIQVYETAIRCAENKDLRKEWQEYLEQTRRHKQILEGVFGKCGLDTGQRSPGREIVGGIGEALVQAMEEALASGNRSAAQLVAAECVVLAETKDHQNWELIGEAAKVVEAPYKKALKEAHDEVEDEEDEHLYHTMGWCRELWMQSLGLPAALPPPEEKRDVKSAIGQARAKQARGNFTKRATATATH